MFNTFFALVSCLNFTYKELSDPIVFQKTVDYFVSVLNDHIKDIGSEPFKTTNIEFFDVVKDENAIDNMILDFEGAGGIIIINRNNEIIYYTTNGDNPLLRSSSNLNIKKGDLYSGEQRIDFVNNESEEKIVYQPHSQSSLDSNYIYYNDLNSYLSSKYSLFDIVLDESERLQGFSNSLPMSTGYRQFLESIYQRWDEIEQRYYSEGNCSLVAISNAIAYYSEYGYRFNFPSRTSTIQVDANTDLAHLAASIFGYYKIEDIRTIHYVYNVIRNLALYNGYYVVNGCSISHIGNVFNQYCESCDYEPYFTHMTSYGLYHFMDELHLSHPTQLYVFDDDNYDNHALMITGAKVFTASSNTNVGTVTYRIVMVSVFDGHSTTERWYDLTYLGTMPPEYNRAVSQEVGYIEVVEPDDD